MGFKAEAVAVTTTQGTRVLVERAGSAPENGSTCPPSCLDNSDPLQPAPAPPCSPGSVWGCLNPTLGKRDIHRCFLESIFTINPTNAPHAPAFIFTWQNSAAGRDISSASIFNLFYQFGKAGEHSLAFQPGPQEMNPFGAWSEIAKWPPSRNRGEEQGEKERKREIKNFYLFSNRNTWNCMASFEIPRLSNWWVILQHG